MEKPKSGTEELFSRMGFKEFGKQHSYGMDDVYRKLRSSPDVYDIGSSLVCGVRRQIAL